MVYPSPTKETRFVNVQSPKHLFCWSNCFLLSQEWSHGWNLAKKNKTKKKTSKPINPFFGS
jgi:hypothetical protein